MGREMFWNISARSQATSAAVNKAHPQAERFRNLQRGGHLSSCVPEGSAAQVQGQTLARITEGSSGLGAQLPGEGLGPGAEAVGAAGQGILYHMTEVVVRAESLKDQIPKRYQRGESPGIELFVAKGQPGGQQ